MRNCTFTDKDGKQYRRITRAMAKRLYNDKKTIVLCPCNLRPFTPHCFEVYVQKDTARNDLTASPDGFNTSVPRNNDFKTVVTYFEFYNCTCNETGRYSAFYTPVND